MEMAARKANIWLHAELDCFWNQCLLAPKQRPDKFPFVTDHIHATPTFEHNWTTSRHADIGGS